MVPAVGKGRAKGVLKIEISPRPLPKAVDGVNCAWPVLLPTRSGRDSETDKGGRICSCRFLRFSPRKDSDISHQRSPIGEIMQGPATLDAGFAGRLRCDA